MGATTTKVTARGESKSPKTAIKTEPTRKDTTDTKDTVNPEPNTDVSRTLAPPPKPGTGNDYFSSKPPGSLSLEPNPFEQSFAPGIETPGGTKLPPVASLTSPSALLPTGNTPFNWPGSLRTGPLSPAMLSGPATQDYFGDTHHFKGFPTPNESSLRTGLTPGGSGSMFPAPSPGTSALFASLNAAGSATPSTLEFQRTAISAASKREHPVPPPSATLPPPNGTTQAEAPAVAAAVAVMAKSEQKPTSAPYDPHDNDAANGLYMLAQGRNGAQPQPPFPPLADAPPQGRAVLPPQQASSAAPVVTSSPQTAPIALANGIRGVSEANSAGSDDSDMAALASRDNKKRNSQSSLTNGRRKAEEPPGRAPQAKKAKTSVPSISGFSDEHSDDDMKFKSEDGSKSKMTEEEKRKNFLERNRVAALKCRQRKKQWLQNLQTKVEVFSSENDMLTTQIQQLREEVVNLKTLLLAHKDCPVTQQQSMAGAGAFIPGAGPESYPTQMAYGMGAPMPAQAVMAGQPGNRRYS